MSNLTPGVVVSQNSRTLKFFQRNHRNHPVTREMIRHNIHREARVSVMYLHLDHLVPKAQSFSQFALNHMSRANQAVFHLFLAHHYRKNKKYLVPEHGNKNSTQMLWVTVCRPGTETVVGYYIFLYDTLVSTTITKNKKDIEIPDSFAHFIQNFIREEDYKDLGLPNTPLPKRSEGWNVMAQALSSITSYAIAIDRHFNQVGKPIQSGAIPGTPWDPAVAFSMAKAVWLKRKLVGPDLFLDESTQQWQPYPTPEAELKPYEAYFEPGVQRFARPAAPPAEAEPAAATDLPRYDDDEEMKVDVEEIVERIDESVGRHATYMPRVNRDEASTFLIENGLCHPLVQARYYMPHRTPYSSSNTPLMRFYRRLFTGDESSCSDEQFQTYRNLYGEPGDDEMYVVFEAFCRESKKEIMAHPESREAMLSEWEALFNETNYPLLSGPLAAHHTFMAQYVEKHSNMHWPYLCAPNICQPKDQKRPEIKYPTDPFGHLMQMHIAVLEYGAMFVSCHDLCLIDIQGTSLSLPGSLMD